jgi:2-aminophenol/2-amino-5-chlorophenol 1,6-dioxygenase alpha subunit
MGPSTISRKENNMDSISKNIKAAALAPGLPHLLTSDVNKPYAELANAVEALGDSFQARGVKRVLYYSTQWLSVLGQSFQAKTDLKGLHVDENWYDLADLPFDFKVDGAFAQKMAAAATDQGFQSKLIDYNGFPVDTGTIVVDQLLNKGRFSTNMVACCVYSDGPETEKLAKTIRDTIDGDDTPTGIVCVSGLSGRWFTTEIDLREDHIRSPEDDEWNRKILGKFESGAHKELTKLIPEYAGACKVDMGFKAYNFLNGVGAFTEGKPAQVRAYGPIYGTGNAVIEM